MVGAVFGAAVVNALDDHKNTATIVGATYGAGLGAASAAEAIDYNRVITKFESTTITDRCMENGRFQILSRSGYGGG